MRCALACFVSVVGCMLVAGQILEPPQQMKYADKAFLEKQKFLLEIVHRIENPLLFEEYLKYAKDFHFEKADYMVSCLKSGCALKSRVSWRILWAPLSIAVVSVGSSEICINRDQKLENVLFSTNVSWIRSCLQCEFTRRFIFFIFYFYTLNWNINCINIYH